MDDDWPLILPLPFHKYYAENEEDNGKDPAEGSGSFIAHVGIGDREMDIRPGILTVLESDLMIAIVVGVKMVVPTGCIAFDLILIAGPLIDMNHANIAI